MDIWSLGMIAHCLCNPDSCHPYMKEMMDSPILNKRQALEGMLIKKQRPCHLPKYQTIRTKYWEPVNDVFQACSVFEVENRPDVEDVLLAFNTKFTKSPLTAMEPSLADMPNKGDMTKSQPEGRFSCERDHKTEKLSTCYLKHSAVHSSKYDSSEARSLETKIQQVDVLEDEPAKKKIKSGMDGQIYKDYDIDVMLSDSSGMAIRSKEDSTNDSEVGVAIDINVTKRTTNTHNTDNVRRLVGSTTDDIEAGVTEGGEFFQTTPIEFTVLGDFHQASENIFSHSASGSQCSTISIMAVLASQFKPPKTWTSSYINDIVRQGDSVHLQVLQNHGWPHLREEVMLDLDEMPHTVECTLGGFKIKASIGCMTGGADYDFDFRLLLSRAKERSENAFVLRLNDRCYAMIRCNDGSFCLFDSHACNALGAQDPCGAACAMFFKDADGIVTHFMEKLQHGMIQGQIDITPVDVEILESTAVVSDSLGHDASNQLLMEYYHLLNPEAANIASSEEIDLPCYENLSYQNRDKDLPIFVAGRDDRFTPKEAVDILLRQDIKVCIKVPLRVRDNKAFLIDVSKLASPDDVKADMNGTYKTMLRIATWTVKVMENGNIDILQKKKIDMPEGIGKVYHLSIHSKKNSAGLVRSIFMLYCRDGRIAGNRCLLQYNVDKSLRVSRVNFEVAPHGNRKHGNDSFYPVQKSTLSVLKNMLKDGSNAAVVYHDLTTRVGGVMAAKHPGQLPRSRQQCYQMKTNQRPADENADLSLYSNCLETQMVIDHYNEPKDVWVLGTKQMSFDLFRFCSTEGKSQPFSIDPTFGFGKFEVTPITYRNMLLTNRRSGRQPIFLGPTAIHLNKETETYDRIISSVIRSCPSEMKNTVKGYITDGEAALCKALKDNFPNAVGLRCLRHYRSNCQDKLKKLGVISQEDQSYFLCKVFGKSNTGGLVDSNDPEELDAAIESMREEMHRKEAVVLGKDDTCLSFSNT